MNRFSIRDLSKFSGIQQHTIRIWEQRFSFLKPGRNKAFRRQYSPEELDLFMDIIFLHQNGYKVSHIATMTPEERNNIVRKLTESNPFQKAIHELIICMAEMELEDFEMVLNNCTIQFGLMQSIEKILLPFAEKVGAFDVLECRNYIENIALIANSLKQKLHTGIELLQPDKGLNEGVLIFSLHTQISHLQLDFLYYYLKKEGFSVIYPSPQLSFAQLELICSLKEPNWIIADVNGEDNPDVLNSLTKRMSEFAHGRGVILLSHKFDNQRLNLEKNIKSVIRKIKTFK